MPRREQRDVGVQELRWVLIAHDDAGGERQEVAGLLGVVPDGRATLGHVRLAQREGQEGHVPVGTLGQGQGKMLMGVAGEGAAVVPGHGERLHSSFNTTSAGLHSLAASSSAATPTPAAGRDDIDDRAQTQAQHRADDCAADDIGGVVGPQMDPARRHRSGESDVGSRPGVGVPQDERGAKGGERVAAREAAARGGAHAGVEMVLGSLPLDRGLDDPAHQE